MKVRLLVLDVDGVLTDGSLLYTANGEEIKSFNVQDGLGLKLLARTGVELAVISGRGSAALARRLDDLGIFHRRFQCKDKVTALADICADVGCTLADVAFMGDDLIDLMAMKAAGYAIAPPNAVEAVRAVADFITPRMGGHGAVRDACEHIAGKAGVCFTDFYTGKD